MIPAGFMAKKVSKNPEWLKNDIIQDIYSVSGCTSEEFCDYINFWKHNDYWLFNSPEIIKEISLENSIDLSEHTFFYYEVFEQDFDEIDKIWGSFIPAFDLETKVKPPINKVLHGYDVVNFYARSSHECSPLSCNHMAESINVNSHCLLPSLDIAKNLLEANAFENCEPGPYRIYAVYTYDV